MLALPTDFSGFIATARRPLVVVLGPTASGKTAFSVTLAHQLRGQGHLAEVVNADSRQLYRLLDIGTAKATPQEQDGIPHHLLSVLDPREPVSIADYQHLAHAVIADLHARGVVPLLVGGSMLYISSVIDGLQPLPKADPHLRLRLEQAYDVDGGVALYRELQHADPDAAAGIVPENKAYLVRAVELLHTLGAPPSAARTTQSVPYDVFIIGLRRSRASTVARIEARTPALLAAGWVEEVAGLLEAGYTEADPGMRSHGYREVITCLRGHGYPSQHAVAATQQDLRLRDAIDAKTRQYAKRQMTWWKHDARIHWIDCD